MPPKSPYKFTKPQHDYLKTHLDLYMAALNAEDSVKEITTTIDTVYDALVKKFQLRDNGEKERDAIRMVNRPNIRQNKNLGAYYPTLIVTHDVV